MHALNGEINKLSTDLHTINYYLSNQAYQNLLGILRPQFKQERETIHIMELFTDSPDIESFQITPSIKLSYFPVSNKTEVGIRLDLNSAVRIGYVSGSSWTSQLSHHLKSCDILICGFGQTSLQDYDRIHYNADSLGYFGSASLIEEATPRLFLCSEVSGALGDLRLEIVKKLKSELHHIATSIIPADRNLKISLEEYQIHCSITKQWIHPDEARIIRIGPPFGQLTFLSPSIVI